MAEHMSEKMIPFSNIIEKIPLQYEFWWKLPEPACRERRIFPVPYNSGSRRECRPRGTTECDENSPFRARLSVRRSWFSRSRPRVGTASTSAPSWVWPMPRLWSRTSLASTTRPAATGCCTAAARPRSPPPTPSAPTARRGRSRTTLSIWTRALRAAWPPATGAARGASSSSTCTGSMAARRGRCGPRPPTPRWPARAPNGPRRPRSGFRNSARTSCSPTSTTTSPARRSGRSTSARAWASPRPGCATATAFCARACRNTPTSRAPS